MYIRGTSDSSGRLAAERKLGSVYFLCRTLLISGSHSDWDEWSKVETYMMDIMQSGVVQANMTKEDVVATCQAMYKAAFATVENNMPSSYIPTIATAVTDGTKNGPSSQSPSNNSNSGTAGGRLS